MADRSSFRYLFNDNFKVLTWILILFIAITPNFIFMNSANAASVGGWSMSNPVAQGASVLYNGAKNVMINGANVAKTSTALITPTATGVAKVLAKGVAGVALSVAVEQLLGAVDWVLDPANNQIKYTDPNTANPDAFPKVWVVNTLMTTAGATPQAACTNAYKYYSKPTSSNTYQTVNTDGVNWFCPSPQFGANSRGAVIKQEANPKYDPKAAENQKKTLPLHVVAAQVISNAESNTDKRAAAQVATTAAAADMVKDAESDNVKARPIVNQLDANAKTETDADANTATGSQTQNPTKPQTIDLKLEFPKFCGWAPIVCEAAQTVISFPKTLTNWWETANEKADSFISMITDFFKSEPEKPSDTSVDVSENSSVVFDDSTRFNFGSTCPQSEQFSVSFFGHTQNLEFSYQPLCQFLSMIKPFVVGGSYLIGAYIVMGLSRGSSD